MIKRILILGGFGFMGQNLNAIFADDNKYEIFNESRKTGCDMADLNKLTWKIKKIDPDIIIYAAAHVGSISYVTEHAAEVVSNNSQMYINLYTAVNQINKYILIINPISNCSYPGIINVQDEDLWWDGSIHQSVESYGMPKKLGFIISECYKKQYGIKTLNLIIPNAYGENDYIDEQRTHAMNGIIMRMIMAKKNKNPKFIVWGTGSPIREWIYMPDVGRIFKEIIDNNRYDLPNPINLGQEKGISIRDTVQLVKEMTQYKGDILYDISRQDGAPIKVLGSKLFKEHFPNFKFTDYETGINNTIRYYKEKL
jgi:GDP-L-fucose synthase